MREGWVSTGNRFDYWSDASGIIMTASKKHRPWQYGLFLVESAEAGIKHDANSPRLAALIDRVKALYQTQEDNEQAWSDVASTLGQCNWNEQVTDPLNPAVQWSEYSALQTLSLLVKEARAMIAAVSTSWSWYTQIANACLQAASYQAAIICAPYPATPAPASEFYKERLEQIAAYERYREDQREAGEDRRQVAYRAMSRYFFDVESACFRQDRLAAAEANAAENARIGALPWHQRARHHLAQWRQRKAA
jgi:hypothetical protein